MGIHKFFIKPLLGSGELKHVYARKRVCKNCKKIKDLPK